MDKITFTHEQEEFLCWIIGEWYLKWKNALPTCDCGSKTHQFGLAKEHLKDLICTQAVELID